MSRKSDLYALVADGLALSQRQKRIGEVLGKSEPRISQIVADLENKPAPDHLAILHWLERCRIFKNFT